MKILVFGSLNIDKVYGVAEFPRPGETILAQSYDSFCGGKGLNQAIAAARAGGDIRFAGMIGEDGAMLAEVLRREGIDIRRLRQVEGASGHAVIQVAKTGQNCIMVYGAANARVDEAFADEALAEFSAGDVVLLQNEISAIGHIIRRAHEKGMTVFFNPSPIDERIAEYPLHLVDYFILNEVEGAHLSGKQEPGEILPALRARFPGSSFVLTLGPAGARYLGGDGITASCGVLDVPVVDTTAAGDTFCGYFLWATCAGCPPQAALDMAMVASNIAVSRAGAEPSIPRSDEVAELYKKVRESADAQTV